MFMSHVENDDVETLFAKSKKSPKNLERNAPKKTKKIASDFKAKTKSKPKKSVKVSKVKVVAPKAIKSNIKKLQKPKTSKAKSYKVSGSFTMDSALEVLKKTKSVKDVSVCKWADGKKPEMLLVTLMIKAK